MKKKKISRQGYIGLFLFFNMLSIHILILVFEFIFEIECLVVVELVRLYFCFYCCFNCYCYCLGDEHLTKILLLRNQGHWSLA